MLRYAVYDFFFFKQKTAYEMRISDWSSDVCSSDLHHRRIGLVPCPDTLGPQTRAAIAQRQVVRGEGGSLRGLLVHRVEISFEAVHQRDVEPVLPDRHLDIGRDALVVPAAARGQHIIIGPHKTGRPTCRESGCKYV